MNTIRLLPICSLIMLQDMLISFLDGNAGYNQIFMVEKDMYKIAFICSGFVG
jgi:hypothetical protein